jgi:hypothetical protein
MNTVQLKCFKSLWEYVQFQGKPLTIFMKSDIEKHMERIASAGYAGIESPMPAEDQEDLFRELLSKYKLEYIAQIITLGDHSSSFADQARRAAGFHPVKIVSQSAKDSMSYDSQMEFFSQAALVEQEIGIAVAHETHRGRALFTPWNTSRLLREMEGLKLNADLSHWCCVCESLLEDREDDLKAAFSRTIHIHGRVGYAEGPQVPDPRAPEYSRQTEAHLRWWEQIALEQLSAGVTEITFTPEFGPPAYMHTLPYTNQPVANIWDVNLWMAQTFRERFYKIVQS